MSYYDYEKSFNSILYKSIYILYSLTSFYKYVRNTVMWSETVGLRTRSVRDQKIGLGLGLVVLVLFFITLVVIIILKDTTTF